MFQFFFSVCLFNLWSFCFLRGAFLCRPFMYLNKIYKVAFGDKEHIKERKSETQFYQVFIQCFGSAVFPGYIFSFA